MVNEAEMINRSIDRYKIENGRYALNPAPVDVLQIVQRLTAVLNSLMEEKGLKPEVSFSGNAAAHEDSFRAKGEDLLLYSMLGNLLKNAVEASPPGGQITISLDEGEAAVVSIHNMGVIPESVSS